MISAVYATYAMQEYSIGEFVDDDGLNRGFNTVSKTGFGQIPSKQYTLSDYFKTLDKLLTNSFPQNYYYLQCNDNTAYSRFYILDKADEFNTPSLIQPEDEFLSDLLINDRIDYLKAEIGSQFIYGYQNLWPNSWAKLRDVLAQFYKISKTMKARNVKPNTQNGSTWVQYERTIFRDSITGVVTSDNTVAFPQKSFPFSDHELVVNVLGVVVRETINYIEVVMDLLTDRMINYDKCNIYFDSLFNESPAIPSQYTLYNYLKFDVITDNEYSMLAPNPRDYDYSSEEGTYYIRGGRFTSSFMYDRAVSEIKTMTLQEILGALKAPTGQYT